MIVFVGFIITVLATARLTRLAIFDRVFSPVRDRIVKDAAPGGLLAYFFECYWCMGFWVSIPVTTATSIAAVPLLHLSWLTLLLLPVTILAVSYAAAFLIEKEEK